MDDGRIGVLAVESGGGSENNLLFWTTEDMISYKYNELVGDVSCICDNIVRD